MKLFHRFVRCDASGRGVAPLASLALVLLGAGVLSGFGSGSPETPGGASTGSTAGGFGAGGGDETVGTLPAYDGGPTFDMLRYARIARPSLYVQGTVDEVLSSAVVVRGDRRVLAQAMPGGELRLVFLGDAQIGFDRNAFHASNLRVGVVVPEGQPILRSAAAWNGQVIWTWTYVYELPIAQFESSGQLDLAPVVAGVATPQGLTSVRAHASVDLVTLTQSRVSQAVVR